MKMPLGSLKQVMADFNKAAKDLVSTGKISATSPNPGPSGIQALSKAASKTSLASSASTTEKTLINFVVSQTDGNLTDSAAGLGTSLNWTEDDVRPILYTEEGATGNLPHHFQPQDQIPFTPMFMGEETAIATTLDTPRRAPDGLMPTTEVGGGLLAPLAICWPPWSTQRTPRTLPPQ
jgi:hypothetical protein